MDNNFNKSKLFYIFLFSLFAVCTSSIFYLINNKPTFELKDERLVENYSLTSSKGEVTGTLYEMDVLYNGKVTSEIINEYVNKLVVDEGIIAVNIKFYNSYDDNKKLQEDSSLKYEVNKVL